MPKAPAPAWNMHPDEIRNNGPLAAISGTIFFVGTVCIYLSFQYEKFDDGVPLFLLGFLLALLPGLLFGITSILVVHELVRRIKHRGDDEIRRPLTVEARSRMRGVRSNAAADRSGDELPNDIHAALLRVLDAQNNALDRIEDESYLMGPCDRGRIVHLVRSQVDSLNFRLLRVQQGKESRDVALGSLAYTMHRAALELEIIAERIAVTGSTLQHTAALLRDYPAPDWWSDADSTGLSLHPGHTAGAHSHPRRRIVEAWRGGFWGSAARRHIDEIRCNLDWVISDFPDGVPEVERRILDVYECGLDRLENERHSFQGRSRIAYDINHQIGINGETLERWHEKEYAAHDLTPKYLSHTLYLESSIADRLVSKLGVPLSATELAANLMRRYAS